MRTGATQPQRPRNGALGRLGVVHPQQVVVTLVGEGDAQVVRRGSVRAPIALHGHDEDRILRIRSAENQEQDIAIAT